jgi:hypothetical protein
MTAIVPVLIAPELVRVVGGKIHIRYRVNHRLVIDGRCNLGQVPVTDIEISQLESADSESLCDYCFGRVDATS